MNPDYTDEDLVDLGRQALTIEIDGLRAQLPRLGTDFARACRICLNCRGRIVVTGMGKSGHIGGKIAATLASTGTPVFFVHPGEASHGDVGMITRDDAVLALSNSGETDEILTIVPVIARLGAIPPRKLVEGFGVRFPNADPAAVPQLSDTYESNVKGLYVVGALGGLRSALPERRLGGRRVQPEPVPDRQRSGQ